MSHTKQWLIATALCVAAGYCWMNGLQYLVVGFVVFVLVKVWYRLDID